MRVFFRRTMEKNWLHFQTNEPTSFWIGPFVVVVVINLAWKEKRFLILLNPWLIIICDSDCVMHHQVSDSHRSTSPCLFHYNLLRRCSLVAPILGRVAKKERLLVVHLTTTSFQHVLNGTLGRVVFSTPNVHEFIPCTNGWPACCESHLYLCWLLYQWNQWPLSLMAELENKFSGFFLVFKTFERLLFRQLTFYIISWKHFN